MVEIVFPYYVKFGRNDSSENEITCSISDKDAKRLENSAKEGGRFHLDEDDEIEDIYNKVYKKVVTLEKDILLSNPEIVADWLSWEDDYNPNKRITKRDVERYLDEVDIGVNYPREFQMLERTVDLPKRRSKYEDVIVTREKVKEYLSEGKNQKTKIVYVDNGETLYWVPQKYSGKLIIPGNVRKIEDGAVSRRNNITELVIDDGIEEIVENTFAHCENLKTVTIPSSVKRIYIRAFYCCFNLEEVILSEGLLEVDSWAFKDCYHIKTAYLPASLTACEASVFEGWIREVYFMGKETKPKGNWYQFEKGVYTNTLYVLPSSEAERFAIENNLNYKFIE